MILNGNGFNKALIGSLVLHALFIGFMAIVPGGEPGTDLTVYTVRVLEVPARPTARDLDLSTSAISALKLDAPTLSPDEPPVPETGIPEAASLELQPQVPGMETAPGSVPLPPNTDSAPQSAPAPEPSQPMTPPVQALPELPAAPPEAGAPEVPQTPEVIAPPIAPPDATPQTAEQSRLSRLKSRVEQLQVESEVPAEGALKAPTTEQSLFALRLFNNKVREAVKENYTFPGGFSENLRTRVMVTLNRDGSVRETKILESSGNERFDRLVCLASINKARYPHVPDEVEGDSMKLTITCTP